MEGKQAGVGGESREAKHAPSLPGLKGTTRLLTAIDPATRLHLDL